MSETFKNLKNEEIILVLTMSLPKTKRFYFKIFKTDTQKCVGRCGIRLEENEENKYLGNIEYEILEQYRGNNYAKKACELLAKVALDYNVESLTITARPDNIASIKTIESLGAKYIEILKVPKNMRLYKTSKEVNVYRWNLEK